ncbi:sulfotransferase family protein [Adonisia turfae]|uniref:Sulfotransferase n=1 Tax=Adonisia turfae CCMR0081 TaxID=2292702 RepID=A0A6M0RIX9_9CYAN|nr:sulfotransferase [Adonisia turfae]NEZ56156.1 sulfotransferase [Adonisia turfae CCMR0081]
MKDSKPMQTLNPIFLVGCPRSGTTLLQQMLDAHPDVAIAPETHFIRNFWLKREHYGDLAEDANYQVLLHAIADIPEFAEMELDLSTFQDAAQTLDRSYAALFTLLLEQFRQGRNTQIVGEKTPNHLLYMQTLQTFFPKARFIHIIRDPRAVINSWKTVPWSTGSVGGDAEVWRRYMATARQSPPDNGAIFTLHYEQLISASEDCLKKLCNFLELSFDASMLDYHTQQSKRVNVNREPWKGNAVRPVNNKSLNRWQTELSTLEIATIEAVASSEMCQLGYKTQSASWPLLKANAQKHTQQKLKLAKRYINKLVKL